jgi:signal transduction histidine kinase
MTPAHAHARYGATPTAAPHATSPAAAHSPAGPDLSLAPPVQTPADPFETREPATGDEAKRSFLRMVSHELRTPLNAIIGFSEIISQELYGPISPQYKEYGEIIRVSGHRMLRLVNQVLEMVKLESGAMEFEPRAEPLDHVFAEAERAVADELAARDITLDVRLPDPVPSAFADSRALRSAIVNLLQNAATYAPEGSTVRLVGRVHGPLVQVAVEDYGEGLDPAEVPRLMRPFEQGENALVRRAEGAGLGWPLVDLLARSMSGRFEVATAPGRGLRAMLTLRRAG